MTIFGEMMQYNQPYNLDRPHHIKREAEMKNIKAGQISSITPESGEEALAKLIKEAGAEARTRKKKAMEYHFKKLHAAACDTLASFERANST